MHFEIAVIAVGLPGEQAFELAPRRFGAQFFERGLCIGDDASLALGLGEFDQLEGIGNLPLDAPIATDRLVEPCAFPQQLLRRLGIIPKAGIFRLRIQLGKTPGRGLPVKDASSAAPATSRCRRQPLEFRRA